MLDSSWKVTLLVSKCSSWRNYISVLVCKHILQVPQEISEQIDKQNYELQVAKSAVLHDSNCAFLVYTTNAAGLAELFLQLCWQLCVMYLQP